jgi:hypothetical protein
MLPGIAPMLSGVALTLPGVAKMLPGVAKRLPGVAPCIQWSEIGRKSAETQILSILELSK